MRVLPFKPIPFFANKNRAFWRLQLAGWGGAMLLRAMSAIANNQSPAFLVIVLIGTITGFSISLVLAVIYRQLIAQRPLVTWGATVLVMPVAVALSGQGRHRITEPRPLSWRRFVFAIPP